MKASTIALEAQLKFTDEEIYRLYLDNPTWHGNEKIINAMIATADNYSPIFVQHEEELEAAKNHEYDTGHGLGYDTGFEDGKELYDNLVEKVESLIQCIESDDTKSNIEIAIAQVKKECP